MAETDWHDILNSFTVGHNEWNRKNRAIEFCECPPVPVSDDVLDGLEERIGFRLPQSYRDFCRVFGGGELSDFHIFIPNAPHESCDIVEANTLYHDREYEEYSPDPEQYQRAYFFARDNGGGIYFWDPQDITKGLQCEFGIYVVYRDDWDTIRLASTFDEFVLDLCLGSRRKELFDDHPPDRVFRPYRNVT